NKYKDEFDKSSPENAKDPIWNHAVDDINPKKYPWSHTSGNEILWFDAPGWNEMTGDEGLPPTGLKTASARFAFVVSAFGTDGFKIVARFKIHIEGVNQRGTWASGSGYPIVQPEVLATKGENTWTKREPYLSY